MMPIRDLTNCVFHRWTVLSFSHIKAKYGAQWFCKCSCGTEKIVRSESLVSGMSKSCGCLNREMSKKKNTIHGMGHSAFYQVWADMNGRCKNKNSTSYKYYGGRGIRVEWETFAEFKTDMYRAYLQHKRNNTSTTIERKNNDGNYSKVNCKWVTQAEQMLNKRKGISPIDIGERISRGLKIAYAKKGVKQCHV